MASEARSEPTHTDEAAEKPTKAELLRQIDEALARQLEARKRFFVALERLERRAR
jgi:hypothetical protein